MKTIAINDIKVPYRITVTSRNQLINFLKVAHHIKDAIEVSFDGVNCTYYICAMDEFNADGRKEVFRRVIILLKRYTPHNFNEEIQDNSIIPDSVFKVICGESGLGV